MERVWSSRLRWRLKGATQWPAFALFVIGDAVLLQLRPISGDGPGLFPALLLSGFFNLIVVAVAAPLAGIALRRRRRDLPQVVAGDMAGTVLLGALAAVIVALGFANHTPAGDRAAMAAGMQRVRAFVAHSAPAEYRRRVDQATTLRFDEHLYRTCVPGNDPRRWLCLFVFTDQNPPGLRVDTNRAPNSSWFPKG